MTLIEAWSVIEITTLVSRHFESRQFAPRQFAPKVSQSSYFHVCFHLKFGSGLVKFRLTRPYRLVRDRMDQSVRLLMLWREKIANCPVRSVVMQDFAVWNVMESITFLEFAAVVSNSASHSNKNAAGSGQLDPVFSELVRQYSSLNTF